AARASMTGMANARVLPVPVCAVATTSRPSSSGGMAWAWTGVGVTNSFLARLFRNAEQRLSSVKWFIDCVRFFRARDLAFGGSGDQRLRRAEAQAVGVHQAGVFGSFSIRKHAQPATSVHQASAVATFARAV